MPNYDISGKRKNIPGQNEWVLPCEICDLQRAVNRQPGFRPGDSQRRLEPRSMFYIHERDLDIIGKSKIISKNYKLSVIVRRTHGDSRFDRNFNIFFQHLFFYSHLKIEISKLNANKFAPIESSIRLQRTSKLMSQKS